MKKAIILTTLMLGIASHSFGQGEVGFGNASSPTATRIGTNSVLNGAQTGLISGGVGAYYFALFSAPTTVSGIAAGRGWAFNDPAWTFTGNIASNTAALGRFAGNYTTGGTVIIPGFLPGTTASLIVVGWSANIGSSLASLVAWYNSNSDVPNNPTTGWLGESAVGQPPLGGGALSTVAIFGNGAGQLATGFTMGIIPVPEPATFTLAGLGAAAMLIFRRRK